MKRSKIKKGKQARNDKNDMPPQQETMATMNMPSKTHMRQGQDYNDICHKEWCHGTNC